MKSLYKIMIISMMFPIVVLTVNSMGIFPYTFYSDTEIQNVYSITPTSTAEGIFSIMLVPNIDFLGVTDQAITISLVVGVFTIAGAAVAIVTHSFAPVIISFMGYCFFVMMTKSMGFVQKIFNNFGGTEMIYLGLLIGIGIVIIVIITIVETPAHGRSGT